MASITDIEGIGPVFAENFKNADVNSVEKLLEAGASKSGRKKLAEATGIDESKILNWVNKADLFRIKGIGSQFSELLEAAGVDTVKELKNRNAANLYAKLVEVQEATKLTRAVPALKQIEDFIEQAKELDAKITY